MNKKFLHTFIITAAFLIFNNMYISAAVPSAYELKTRFDLLRNMYPTGTEQETFYNSTYDGELCYKDLSGYSSWECLAWGCKVFDILWGQSISSAEEHKDVQNICIGDYVRFNASNIWGTYDHSIVITNIEGNILYYTDNNSSGNGRIVWDKTISKSDLQTKVNKVLVWGAGKSGYIKHFKGNTYKSLDDIKPQLNAYVIKIGNSYSVKTEFENINKKGNVLICGYKNKRLAAHKNRVYNLESEITETLTGDFDTIKVLITENINSLTPICSAAEIKQKDFN